MSPNLIVCLLLLIPTTRAAIAADATDALDSHPNIKVVDDRLELQLFAEAPDIVTPVDLDVDERGRVFVIESHTHFRPAGYDGPTTDRIRVFEDTDSDGVTDTISTFHAGETHTMGMKWHWNGWLYVATRREVFRLRDTDGDGRADVRQSLAILEGKGSYPHDGLNGFAFDFTGNVYFGFGENLGVPYKLVGADGTSFKGGGEGGNIYRISATGKKLTSIATGFWNPFGLGFDTFGNLFAVDNDPGGRPPCRLLHIVDGGDYGYRYRYGRGGRHPFTSWNGEVPGTLPMLAGTGEAPCEVIAYESDNLPRDYVGKLLVTSWGDHRIEAYDVKQNGASFKAKMKTVVQGDKDFRPVGLATAPDGSIFFSDWVDRSYKLHSKGRIWRLSARKPASDAASRDSSTILTSLRSVDRKHREAAARKLVAMGPVSVPALREVITGSDDATLRSQALAVMALKALTNRHEDLLDRVSESILLVESQFDAHPDIDAASSDFMSTWILLVRSFPDAAMAFAPRPTAIAMAHTQPKPWWKNVSPFVRSDGPFARHAAVQLLLHDKDKLANLNPLTLTEGPKRVAVMLAQRRAMPELGALFLPALLKDSDADVRFLAAQWIAESKLVEHRGKVVKALAAETSDVRLVAGYMAALELLDGKNPNAADQVGAAFFIRPMLHDENASAPIKVLALRATPPSDSKLTMKRLKALIDSDDATLQVEAVRSLRFSQLKQREKLLMEIATDLNRSTAVKAEAVAGLSGDSELQQALLFVLATGQNEVLRDEALRSFRGTKLADATRELLQRWSEAHPDMVEVISRIVTDVKVEERPPATDIAAWLKQMDEQDRLVAARLDADVGDANGDKNLSDRNPVTIGERLFFHPKAAGCYRCHTIHGRGANIGPDLSNIASSHDRKRLLESILQPSREIGPTYSVSMLELPNGDIVTGVNIGREKGVDLWADASGKIHKIRWSEPVARRALESSLMPSGLHEALTTSELHAMLAFLESLK